MCVCVRSCVFTAHFWYQQPNSWITWWFGPRGVELQARNSPKNIWGMLNRSIILGIVASTFDVTWDTMIRDDIGPHKSRFTTHPKRGWMVVRLHWFCLPLLSRVEPWWSHFWPHRNPTFQTDFGP